MAPSNLNRPNGLTSTARPDVPYVMEWPNSHYQTEWGPWPSLTSSGRIAQTQLHGPDNRNVTQWAPRPQHTVNAPMDQTQHNTHAGSKSFTWVPLP